MAVGPVTVYDFFHRSNVNNWGTTSSGHAWNGDDFDFYDVAAGNGKIYVQSGRATPAYHTYVSGFDEDRAEVLCRMQWNTSQKTDHGPILRRTDDGYLFLRIKDSDHQITIASRVNGVTTDLASFSVTLLANTDYWVRFRVDTLIRAKIWAASAAEPGSFQVTAAIPGNAPASGSIGYRNVTTSGGTYTIRIDELYGYTLDEAQPSLPVTDTFSRSVDDGFGVADTGHAWDGDFAADPAAYVSGLNGTYADVDATSATVTLPTGVGQKWGFIGPSAALTEATVKLSANQANATARLGIHAVESTSGGSTNAAMYYARLNWGNTSFQLYDRDLTTLLGSFSLAAAPVVGDSWWIKIRGSGATISAKAWKDGTAEPGAFQISVTDATSPVTAGRAAINLSGPAGVTTVFELYDFTFGFIAPDTTRLTTGTLSAIADTTSLSISAAYTNDTDNDSSCVIQYRKQGATSWTTATSSVNRTTKIFSADIYGLTASTFYDLKATFTDPDGVVGTNPRTLTIKTLNLGIETKPNTASAGATTVDVVAPYIRDSDSDSICIAEAHETGEALTNITVDTFTAADGTDVTTRAGETGATWTKHPSYTAGASIEDNALYNPNTTTTQLYSSAVPSSNNYITEVTLDIVSDHDSHGGAIVRMHQTQDNAYRFHYRTSTKTLTLDKVLSGSVTVLASKIMPTWVSGTQKVLRLEARGSLLVGYVDGVVVLAAWDTSITAVGRGGVYLKFNGGGTKATRGTRLRDAKVIYPSKTSFQKQLTADRPNLRFTGQLTGLANDTNYQVRTFYYDVDDTLGINPQLTSVTTLGKGIALSTLLVEPNDVSAVVTVDYDLDNNDDATCSMVYKSIRDDMWTAVNPESIQIHRGSKVFTTVLTSLIPNLTYQITVIAEDPDGTATGSPAELSTVFTTTGRVFDPDYQGKHYVWKVYDRDDAYLGTWHDAPEPNFDYFTNGGVSDQSPVLPRTLSQAAIDRTLTLGNRVDIWAIDGQSKGFGPNLLLDSEMNLGSWTLTTSWAVNSTAGPDGSSALRFNSSSSTIRTVQSESVNLAAVVPLVVTAVAKAKGGKLRFDMAAYNASDVLLGTSTDYAETVGPNWQEVSFSWLPPAGTAYVRVRAENTGAGTMFFDKVSVRPQELLIYSGRIETITPSLDEDGQRVKVKILGPVAQLGDMYLEHLQYVSVQPSADIEEDLPKNNPTDPATMMKDIIDYAIRENPRCTLYYTADSINLTGTIAEYTFKEIKLADAFDTIVDLLCPPGWYYYVDADGLVHLNGAQHAVTHPLRVQVDIRTFENAQNVDDLKNYILVLGKKDSDDSEPDGDGTIRYVALDQESIDTWGRREELVRDSNVKTQAQAEVVGDGKLEELNVVRQEAVLEVPDEKDLRFSSGILRGYNIEGFRPGDFVKVYDPIRSAHYTYFDKARFDIDRWDINDVPLIPDAVRIETIKYRGSYVELELAERKPSATGAYAKLKKQLRLQEQNTRDR